MFGKSSEKYCFENFPKRGAFYNFNRFTLIEEPFSCPNFTSWNLNLQDTCQAIQNCQSKFDERYFKTVVYHNSRYLEPKVVMKNVIK